MSNINVITTDGHAQSAKTTCNEAIYTDLSSSLRVYYGDAGRFFRIVTAATLQEVDSDHPKIDDKLFQAMDHVLSTGIAYEPGRDWGDLSSGPVEDYVSRLGRNGNLQKAAEEWYVRTANCAQELDSQVLLVAGRNPWKKLEPWVNANGAQFVLNAFMDCEVMTAAERSLLARGIKRPTTDQIIERAAGIEQRRQSDLTRPVNPLIVPVEPVVVETDQIDPVKVVELSQAGGEATLRPIYIDNTRLEKAAMIQLVTGLARASMGFLVKL